MTTNQFFGSISVALALAFTAATAAAHHSRANFDLEKVVEFEGAVTRFEWVNPHTAIVVAVQTPDGKAVTKTVEGNAIATMMRRGFKRDSVKVGDRVRIVANPERIAGSEFYYLNSISVNGVPMGGGDGPGRGQASVRDTETPPRVATVRRQALATTMSRSVGRDSAKAGRLYSYLNAAFVSRAPGGGVAARSEQQASNADAQAIRRFVGVWRQGGGAGGGGGRGARANTGGAGGTGGTADAGRGDRGGGARGAGARGGGNAILLGRPMPSNLPVTEKGAASYAKFDYVDDPLNDCVPESLPAAISSAPYLFGIRQEGGNLVFENENYAAARTIHMGQTRPPAGTKSDYDGYSVGRIEGGVLVIDTTLFSPQPWGNDTGLDSSEQKHMVERWTVTDGGQLQVTYVQTDPVYLSKPVTRTVTWTSTNAPLVYVWEVSTCSPEAGNRHLTEGHNPFEKKP